MINLTLGSWRTNKKRSYFTVPLHAICDCDETTITICLGQVIEKNDGRYNWFRVTNKSFLVERTNPSQGVANTIEVAKQMSLSDLMALEDNFHLMIKKEPKEVNNYLLLADWYEDNNKQAEADYLRELVKWFPYALTNSPCGEIPLKDPDIKILIELAAKIQLKTLINPIVGIRPNVYYGVFTKIDGKDYYLYDRFYVYLYSEKRVITNSDFFEPKHKSSWIVENYNFYVKYTVLSTLWYQDNERTNL